MFFFMLIAFIPLVLIWIWLCIKLIKSIRKNLRN